MIQNIPVEEDNDLTPDEAAISALKPKLVGDIQLKPFSLMRQVVALDIIGKGGGYYYNAILTVWVCTLEPSEVLAAQEDREHARIKAFEWAESLGVNVSKMNPITKAYDKLNQELVTITRVSFKDNGTEPKNDGGQPE
jgi:hypothetical protein